MKREPTRQALFYGNCNEGGCWYATHVGPQYHCLDVFKHPAKERGRISEA
jgi:hypothetical protein